jgi:LysM repeat protein
MQMDAKSGSNVHVVKPGETLYRISRRYGVKVDLLRKWNKLPDDIIEVGQKLIVSHEQ